MGPCETIDPLIEALLNPSRHGRDVTAVTLVETHISWVLLTGKIALKIKKPVKLPFLDFSSADSRRRYCEEEIRLNRRLAPEIYLDVVSIGGTRDDPVLEREPAFDYAVRMREFPSEARVDRRIADGAVLLADIVDLAELVGEFHAQLPAAPAGPGLGTAAVIVRSVEKNLAETAAAVPANLGPDSTVHSYLLEQGKRLKGALNQRKQAGAIKECHGDLHLENLVCWQDRILPFDALEFDPELRWIDVIDETAFLVMDLIAHGATDLAFTFLNRYLEITGDYDGLSVLRYYLVHRALVRAKVRAIKAAQSEDTNAAEEARPYLELAERLVTAGRPLLLITYGFSGSGKSTQSAKLIPALPAIRIRSDIERKRLAGFSERERSDSPVGGGIYAEDMSASTYATLARHAEAALRAGLNVIVDAAFLVSQQRELFADLADRTSADHVIFECAADPLTLRNRVAARQAANASISEADVSVLEHQLETSDRLTDAERRRTASIDTEITLNTQEILEQIQAIRHSPQRASDLAGKLLH
jgi:aminoglycoside phosphotransferase family enzyme/predicted kinase